MSTNPVTIMRKIEFDAAHRVLNHESKCSNLHGHRYVVEIHARPGEFKKGRLDDLGRVIDFSCLKGAVGKWIDDHWDHTTILYGEDVKLLGALEPVEKKKPIYIMPCNPTAENMAIYLLNVVCPDLMEPFGVEVHKVVVWETPNCFATAQLQEVLN